MKVVAIVDTVAEVQARIIHRRALLWGGGGILIVFAARLTTAFAIPEIASARNDPAPSLVVDEGCVRVHLQPSCYTKAQAFHHVSKVGLLGLAQLPCNGHKPCEACNHLSGEVGVAHAEFIHQRELEFAVRQGSIPECWQRAAESLQDSMTEALVDWPWGAEAHVREEVIVHLPCVRSHSHRSATDVTEWCCGRGYNRPAVHG
mmetsp:Transcript_51083/g.134164  ORF Transcript_51083/g.134164 Transcript_51083/m.134164 type:complete len:203 (+) Transcript_51083:1099-1707(+)